MVGDEGFEPPRGGVKVRCLTAWLIPNTSPIVRTFFIFQIFFDKMTPYSTMPQFLGSSVVEQLAVNQLVVGSNPTRGAILEQQSLFALMQKDFFLSKPHDSLLNQKVSAILE